jgi:hypothetical protein
VTRRTPRPNRRRTDRNRKIELIGDFPPADQDIRKINIPDGGDTDTETLAPVFPEYDGRTFGPAPAGQDTEPFTRTRRSRLYRVPVAPLPPPTPAAVPQPLPRGPQPDPLDPLDPFPGNVAYDTIGRELLTGWPHLEEIRCTYPAANHPTPIPCGAIHRDDTAGSLWDLRRSAFTAGWHLDAFGQWACPRCCQDNPTYRTLYPVNCWHPNSTGAYLAGHPDTEFWFRNRAAIDVALRTSAAFANGHRHRTGATR